MRGCIVIFRLPPGTKNVELSKFCQKFYGQDTSSHGGKYRYHRHGLLDDIPHRKLLRGVIVIRKEHLRRVVDFLEQYHAEKHVREIKLSDEDEVVLSS